MRVQRAQGTERPVAQYAFVRRTVPGAFRCVGLEDDRAAVLRVRAGDEAARVGDDSTRIVSGGEVVYPRASDTRAAGS